MRSGMILKSFVLCLLIYIPFLLFAQDKGINFENNLGWLDVLEKAKTENKYIFVDCYTSWCGPCKKMDYEVYSKDSVGRLMNNKFISIKLQMDTSKNDNNDIQRMYSVAHAFVEKYSVYSYPTFLFFSPEGELVHRVIGYKNEAQFVSSVDDATNPGKQYYILLRKYNNRRASIVEMAYLMKMARLLNDQAVLKEIGFDYVNNYLAGLKKNDLLKKENIDLLYQFTESSKDKGFEIFRKYGVAIDSVMDGQCSRNFFDKIIYKEEIGPALDSVKKNNSNPDWSKMSISITRKYGKDYADRTIARIKVNWFKYKKDWISYTKWIVISIDKYASPEDKTNSWYINNQAWEVFKYSNKHTELTAAVNWLKYLISQNDKKGDLGANELDTFANLLYKLGKTSEAIAWEEKASKIDSKDKEIAEALVKMKNGEPTWTSPN